MPEFDPNAAMSTEVPAMLALAELMSTTAAWQDIARATGDPAAALLKVKVAESTEPWDQNDGRITRAQLEEEIVAQADITPGETDDYAAFVNVGDPEGRCPNVTGTLEVRVISWISEEDWEEFGEGSNYNWFTDRTAALCEQLHLRADATGDLLVDRVRRVGKPLWNEEDSWATQGRHLWVVIMVEYGSRFTGSGGGS